MFDQDSNPTLSLKLEGAAGCQYDKKQLFASAALCLMPNPQISTKSDLNELNEHSVKCLIIYQTWCQFSTY